MKSSNPPHLHVYQQLQPLVTVIYNQKNNYQIASP